MRPCQLLWRSASPQSLYIFAVNSSIYISDVDKPVKLILSTVYLFTCLYISCLMLQTAFNPSYWTELAQLRGCHCCAASPVRHYERWSGLGQTGTLMGEYVEMPGTLQSLFYS